MYNKRNVTKLSLRKCEIVAAMLLLLSFAAAPRAIAQNSRKLKGHVPPAVRNLNPVGRLPASTQLTLAIGLPLRNPEGLNDFLQEIYDPTSPRFRHYLTTGQFTEMFGPTEQDYDAVIAFASSHRLS